MKKIWGLLTCLCLAACSDIEDLGTLAPTSSAHGFLLRQNVMKAPSQGTTLSLLTQTLFILQLQLLKNNYYICVANYLNHEESLCNWRLRVTGIFLRP